MPHSECSSGFAACGGALLIILINKPSERFPAPLGVMIVGWVLKTSWLSMCVSDPGLKAMASNQCLSCNYISLHDGSCSRAFTGEPSSSA